MLAPIPATDKCITSYMHTIYEADVKQLIHLPHLSHQLHAELGTCTPLYPSGGPWWQCVRESADREEERRSKSAS